MSLQFDHFGTPLCDECRHHAAAQHERLRNSWRAVLASGEPLGPMKKAYFTAFHDGGHLVSDEELAVDAVDPTPRSALQRWRESRS